MPKFNVYLNVTRKLEKPISVFARDEAEAEEKAVEIVNKWGGVIDAEPLSVEPFEDER